MVLVTILEVILELVMVSKEERDWDKTTVYEIDNKKFAERGNITTESFKSH